MLDLCKCGRYARSASWLLGAGSSGRVERCYDRATGKPYAVKILPEQMCKTYPNLIENELAALTAVASCRVSRVVQLVDAFWTQDKGFALILELVDGSELSTWPGIFSGSVTTADKEQQVKRIAVQLLETLAALHQKAHTAHLDLSSGNIMMRNGQADWFDQLRLLDFGLSQQFFTDAEGLQVTGIRPWGGSLQYTSPQHLRAMQRQAELEGLREHRQSPAGCHDLQHLGKYHTADHKTSKLSTWWKKALCCTGRCPEHENAHHEREYTCDKEELRHEPELLIDGRAADVWSCGVLLYELLVGELPFKVQDLADKPVAMSWMPDHFKHGWEDYEEMLCLQIKWAGEFSALVDIKGTYNVDHPLLNKIRAVSAEPEAAAEFFGMLLYPWESRISAHGAQDAAYLKDVKSELDCHRQEAAQACAFNAAAWPSSRHDNLPQPSASAEQPLPCIGHSKAADKSYLLKSTHCSTAVPADLPASAALSPAEHVQASASSLPSPAAVMSPETLHLCHRQEHSSAPSRPTPLAIQCCPARHRNLHPQPEPATSAVLQTAALPGLQRAFSATAALSRLPHGCPDLLDHTQQFHQAPVKDCSPFIAAHPSPQSVHSVSSPGAHKQVDRLQQQKVSLLPQLQPGNSAAQEQQDGILEAKVPLIGTKAAVQHSVGLSAEDKQAGGFKAERLCPGSAGESARTQDAKQGKPGKQRLKKMYQKVKSTVKSCKRHAKDILQGPFCCRRTALVEN